MGDYYCSIWSGRVSPQTDDSAAREGACPLQPFPLPILLASELLISAQIAHNLVALSLSI